MSFGVDQARGTLKHLADSYGPAWIGRWLEIATERFYSAVLTEGDFAIDVGANRARHTIPLARAVGATGKVLAIEAASTTAQKLAGDIVAAKLPNANVIEIAQIAVSDFTGSATFSFIPSATGLSGLKSEELAEKWPDMVQEAVQVRQLDDVVAPGRAVRFIKLDIEGAELSALRGGTRILREHRPALAFENGGLRYARRFNYTSADFFGFFEGIGYRLFTPLCTEFGIEWDNGFQPPQVFALPIEAAEPIERNLAPALIQAMADAFTPES